ncbi:lipopolysaccharide kinase InaA family protein [Acetonema longum]|uniref:Tyrosine protein kinase n=1 Tax=Acetonema longum DSM 6540 TaxID=1009370 RepID=F7NP29_9FIRM|nr:lipopolysaccharide kinase InaA family protein [Acetonema longum]EGO62152.1 hypothetical protein ALO_19352 [Acetonema longum DSM 6540]
MNIVLNPQFAMLKDFVYSLPDTFAASGEVIYKARNEIRIFTVQGFEVNVKKFKTPHILNRIVYTFFRLTKARRSYENALQLLEKGIETPAPIAYIEMKAGKLFSEGYFISLQCPYPYNFRKFEGEKLSDSGNEAVLAAFARFTARLHESQVLHLDYSPGNILFDVNSKEARFTLLDINRMNFCPVDQATGCRNFERLWGSDEMFLYMADIYARERGFDPGECRQKILRAHLDCMTYFDNKKIIKQNLKEKNYKACFPLWYANLKYLYFCGR